MDIRRQNCSVAALILLLLMAGCDVMSASKQDSTTRAIFEAGKSDPRLINEVEYVPLFPFFTSGGDQTAFDFPQDIYAGFDEQVYVVDRRGLHVLDVSGRPETFVPIPGGGTSVTQDRRLRLYVTARRDTLLNGRTWNLPVVLRYDYGGTGNLELDQIIWHPFDDDSRLFNRPDPIDTDEDVVFTGVSVLFNNNILVSRKGPVNDRTSVVFPHNIILEYSADGLPVRAIVSLNPTRESLRSSLYPEDVATYVQPPQRSFFEQTRHFLLIQSPMLEDVQPGVPSTAGPMRFPVLSIRAVDTPDGLAFQTDSRKLQIASDPDNGHGFLYEEFKFSHPSDLAVAGDESNYIFVLDAGSDSLFVFTGAGVEGVSPPPGSGALLPVPVSFGGTGDGASEFRTPLGVAYFNEVVYVADTGNNRISRFRLNTDFE